MKISYEKTVPITPKLHELRAGELFRPTRSEQVFMRTGAFGSDEFTSEKLHCASCLTIYRAPMRAQMR